MCCDGYEEHESNARLMSVIYAHDGCTDSVLEKGSDTRAYMRVIMGVDMRVCCTCASMYRSFFRA